MSTATDRRNEWWRELRRLLILRRGGCCRDCGATENLEFAHVRKTGLSGRSRGFKARVKDVRDHPRAYRLLCRPCHNVRDGRPWNA